MFNATAPAGWRAGSAGTDPKGKVRDEAVAAMREIGLDISRHVPRSLEAVLGPDVELVVGLCAEEACPVVPGVRSLHWPIANPAGGGIERYRDVREELRSRIAGLVDDLRQVPRRAVGDPRRTGMIARKTALAMVEIPRGSRNKYEMDPIHGGIRLDRVLYSPLHYPADYGFIRETLAEDGDHLDVLIFTYEPTFPGCLVEVRPIGVLNMRDEKGLDQKILAVPVGDPRFEGIVDLDDMPPHFLKEVQHFFTVYKELEQKPVEIYGWAGAEDARRLVGEAQHRHAQNTQT